MSARRQFRRPAWPFVPNQDSEQARGLVMWMPLGAAGGWYDLSRYKRDFTNVGTTLYDDPTMGRVRDFNGTNQYILADSSPVTEIPLTLASWFNADNNTSQQALIILQQTGASGRLQSFSLELYGAIGGDPIAANTSDATNTNSALTTIGYTLGTFHHACGVFASATDRRAFIDGGGKNTNPTSRTPSGISQIILGISGSLSLDFDGRQADVRVYNRALSDDEVFRLWDERTRWGLYYRLGRRKTFMPPRLSKADASGIVISGGGGTIIRGAA